MQENEAELKLEKLEEFTKAELAAAIASEKATQLEKMAEANLNVRYSLKSHRIDTAAC
jgi:mitofilin